MGLSRREFITLLSLTGVAGGGLWAAAEIARINRLVSVQSSTINTQSNLLNSETTLIAKDQEIISTQNARSIQLSVESTQVSIEATQSSVQSTQVAWSMLPYRVEATVQAYKDSPEDLEKILEKMPDVLMTNSFNLTHYFKVKEKGQWVSKGGQGSCALVQYDSKTGFAYFLTAGHAIALWDTEYQTEEFLISQPQLNNDAPLHFASYGLATASTRDIGLLRLNMNGFSFPDYINDNVVVNSPYYPEVGETLYSVDFPYESQKVGLNYMPHVFKVLSKPEDYNSVSMFYVDDITNGGGSGGVVCNGSGEFVGVVHAITNTNGIMVATADLFSDMKKSLSS